MAAKYLSAANAAALDKDLMSLGAFSLDQLMELAGLSVSQVGGDGLVAARHLWHYGYKPTIYYPKQGKNELYQRLSTQLRNLSIPFTEDFSEALKESDHIVDAIFETTSLPITSIDAPSSWDIAHGPPSSGPGANFMPQYLISLTAPKPLVRFFKGRHFLGGRFVTPEISEKYNLQLPEYEGVDQIVEMPVPEEEKL
ncbi:hypothetical protein ACHAO1_009476 [Botrytis cinerea]